MLFPHHTNLHYSLDLIKALTKVILLQWHALGRRTRSYGLTLLNLISMISPQLNFNSNKQKSMHQTTPCLIQTYSYYSHPLLSSTFLHFFIVCNFPNTSFHISKIHNYNIDDEIFFFFFMKRKSNYLFSLFRSARIYNICIYTLIKV